MLAQFLTVNYTGLAMGPDTETEALTLGGEFAKRLAILGYSRREFVRRSGISRQTLHKIEHEGHTDLWDQTYAQLDEHLMWAPGTARGLAHGTITQMASSDALSLVERESAYRWQIVERIQSMSLDQLERLVAVIEGENLGTKPDVMLSSDHIIALVEAKITERLRSLTGGTFGGPVSDDESSKPPV